MRTLLVVAAVLVAGLALWRVTVDERAKRETTEPPATPVARQSDATTEPVRTRNTKWSVQGRVRGDESGRPIRGARVTVYLTRGHRKHRYAARTTDAKGEFRVDLEKVRAWSRLRRYAMGVTVEVQAPGFANDDPDDDWQLPLDADEPLEAWFDLTLLAGATIEGRVLDDQGRPVPDANVFTRRRGVEDYEVGRETDAHGRFRIWIDAPGSWEIVAERAAFGRATKPVDLPRFRHVDIGDLVLGGGLTLEGVVAYPDGTPLPHAQVEFARMPKGADGVRFTDADGRLRATGLADSKYWAVLAELNTETGVGWRVRPPGYQRFVVRSPRLTVRIIGRDTEPLVGIPFSVLTWLPGVEPEVGTHDRMFEQSAISRADGRADFYFERGTFVRVGVSVLGHGLHIREFRLDELRDYTVTFRLKPAEQTGALRTTLLVGGRPVPHRLRLRAGGVFVGEPRDISAGEIVEGVSPGEYRAYLSGVDDVLDPRSYIFPVTRRVIVRPGAPTLLRVESKLGARLRVLVDFAGDAVEVDGIYLGEEPLDWVGSFVDGRPKWMEGLHEPGRYRVRIELDDRAPMERAVELLPGKVTILEVP